MIPARVAIGVYFALTLNVMYLVMAIGLSTVRPTALASDLGDALRRDGYEVPFSLIHQHLKASHSSQNQFIYLLILPSTAILGLCTYYVTSKSGPRYDHGEETRTVAAKSPSHTAGPL